MKSASTALAAHLAGEVTTLATCWRIARTDGQVFRFTDHDRDLLVEGETYRASTGYSRTAVASDADLAVDNLEVEGVFDSEELSEADLRAGRFDRAEVRIFLVNWADPGQGVLKLRRGWFGEVVLGEQGIFRTELRGLTQALAQRIGELYGPECRADLGDHRCRVPVEPPLVARGAAYAKGDVVRVATIEGATGSQAFADRIHRCTQAGVTAAVQPAYGTTVGTVTVDGTAAFTAEEAWTRAGTVLAIENRTTFTAAVHRAAGGGRLVRRRRADLRDRCQCRRQHGGQGLDTRSGPDRALPAPGLRRSSPATCSASIPAATSASTPASPASPTS